MCWLTITIPTIAETGKILLFRNKKKKTTARRCLPLYPQCAGSSGCQRRLWRCSRRSPKLRQPQNRRLWQQPIHHPRSRKRTAVPQLSQTLLRKKRDYWRSGRISLILKNNVRPLKISPLRLYLFCRFFLPVQTSGIFRTIEKRRIYRDNTIKRIE